MVDLQEKLMENIMPSTTKPVMVIGAGVAGIQASLDLANAGVPVILVERKGSIGGAMAALDKTFPTLDCSICIEAPLMNDVMNNPNIEVKTLTEVQKIDGEAGKFTVTLNEKQRFVTDACTRCDLCVPACPQTTVQEFDEGLSQRSAIYTPFAQAEPGAYIIDIDLCLNDPPNNMPCTRCQDACLPQAISFNQYGEDTFDVEVAAVITSTGFDMLDPSVVKDYGYGNHPDILTSMEFERMVNAAGPTAGHLMRPSNKEDPESALFVLCVGSRDQRYCAYCSRVCCMYSIKEAHQAYDHGIKDVTVLYMDIRAYGKGFDEFHERTLKEGVKYIRGRPSKIDTEGEKPLVTYEDTELGKIMKKEFDMIVLAPALLPPKGTDKLAELLGVNLDMDGFIETNEIDGFAVATTRPGVFVAGCASGPKDIPDSVAEASAAAAASMIYTGERFWPLEVYEETIDAGPDAEEKIGVFVCDCGSNIAGVIDVPSVVDFASGLDGVVHAEEVQFACAGATAEKMTQIIKEKGLNRLVVSACSPKTHSPTFQRAAAKGGLNKYMFEMTNLRNHNSWVHKDLPVLATEKARDMVRMSVEKAKHLVPLTAPVISVTQRAIVVGGGPAGMAAAWNLGGQGYDVHLLEKSDKLGGMLNKLDIISPTGQDAKKILAKMMGDVEKTGVNVYLNTTIEEVSGAVGNYHVKLSAGEELTVGAIILAYGSRPYEPTGHFYGQDERVITNLILDQTLYEREEENVTFLFCVGSRNEKTGCARYCCSNAMMQAMELAKQGKHVTCVYKDIRTFSRHGEELYFEAAKAGVVFVQMPQNFNPETDIAYEDGLIVTYDELLGQNIAIPTDLLVHVVGMQPPADHGVADLLKVSRTEDDFLLELHPKLGPVEAAVGGVYMAGAVRGPVTLDEAISMGLATASKASDLLSKDTTTKAPLMALIDEAKCTGCSRCSKVCPYGAIEGNPINLKPNGKFATFHVIEAACAGCGTCAAECNADAITMPSFTDAQIFAQIDEALRENPEDKILTFACNWCSYAGADQAGIAKIQYPTASRIIRTMCSGRVSEDMVMRGFEKGAGAVLVTGCRLTEKGSDCHYNFANAQTWKRFQRWKKKLGRMNIADERLQLQWISAAEGKKLAETLYDMEDVLKRYRESLEEPMAPTGGD